MDYGGWWLAAKGSLAFMAGGFFMFLCNRAEKVLEVKDQARLELAREERQREIRENAELKAERDALREQVKHFWDEGHTRDRREIVILGILAALSRRGEELCDKLDGDKDHDYELRQLREVLEKVAQLKELRLE